MVFGEDRDEQQQGIQWQARAPPKATEEVLCREDRHRRVAYTAPRSTAVGHHTTHIAHAKHADVRSASLRTRRLSFCEAAMAARSSTSSASSSAASGPAAAPCSGGAYGVPQTAQLAAWAEFSIVQAGHAQGASAAYSIAAKRSPCAALLCTSRQILDFTKLVLFHRDSRQSRQRVRRRATQRVQTLGRTGS